MRKDILLSLIAATGFQTAAYADINVTSDAKIDDVTLWKATGVGVQYGDGNLLGNKSIVVNTGAVSHLTFPVTDLPKGKYRITAKGENLKLSVGDVVLTTNGMEEDITFDNNSDEGFIVKIESNIAGRFTLTALKLEVVIDFEEIKDYLESLTETVGEDQVAKRHITDQLPNPDFDETKEGTDTKVWDLRNFRKLAEGELWSNAKTTKDNLMDPDHSYLKQAQALRAEKQPNIAGIKALVESLGTETLETYRNAKMQLWDFDSEKPEEWVFTQTVKDTLDYMDAYLNELEVIHAKSLAWYQNMTFAQRYVVTGYTGTGSGEFLKLENGSNCYFNYKGANQYKDEVATYTSTNPTVTAAVDAFNEAYDNFIVKMEDFRTDKINYGTLKDKNNQVIRKEYLRDLYDLSLLAEAARQASVAAAGNEEAYALINNEGTGYLAQIEKAYLSLYGYMMGLHGTYGSEQANKLTVMKNDVVTVLQGRTLENAGENKTGDANLYNALMDNNSQTWDVEKSMYAFVNATSTRVEAAEALYMQETGKKEAKADADTIYAGLAKSRFDLEQTVTPKVAALNANNKLKTTLQEEVDALAELISTAQKKADDALENYENGKEGEQVSIEADITAIDARIAVLLDENGVEGSIKEAENAEAAYNDNLAKLNEYNNDVGSAYGSLTQASANIVFGDETINLDEKYKPVYDAVMGNIQKVKNQNDDYLKGEEGVTAVTSDQLTFIEEGVTAFTESASATSQKFSEAYNEYSTLNNKLTSLKALVNEDNVIIEYKDFTYEATIPGSETPVSTTVKVVDEGLSNMKVNYRSANYNGTTCKTGFDQASYNFNTYQSAIDGIKSGIMAAADKDADAMLKAINDLDLNPGDVKGKMDETRQTFASHLIEGNEGALEAHKALFENRYNASGAAETYGPYLDKENEGLKAKLATYSNMIAALEAGLSEEMSVVGSNTTELKKKNAKASNNSSISNLVDERTTSTWQANGIGTNNYIQYDLGGLYDKATLIYAAGNNSRTAYHATSLLIQGSHTASNSAAGWEDVATIDVSTEIAANSYLINNPKQYRYLRVSAKEASSNSPISGLIPGLTQARWVASVMYFKVTQPEDAVEAYTAINNKVKDLHDGMVTELKTLETACIANVAAKAAIDARGSEYSQLKALIEGAAEVKEGEEVLFPAVASLADEIKAKDGDANDRPANTYFESDEYKAINLTAIDKAISDAYNSNSLTADCQKQEIEEMTGKISALITKVENNAAYHEALTQAYADLHNEIYGKAAVPAVGTEDEEGYKPAESAVLSLEAWLNENSVDPAKASWKADKGDPNKYTTLEPEMARIEKAIDDRFVATTLNADTEAANITALQNSVNNFKTAVLANESNHNDQMKNAQDAIGKLDRAIAAVQNSGYAEDVEFEFEVNGKTVKLDIEGVEQALVDLRQELTTANNKIYSDYQNLKSEPKENNPYAELNTTMDAYLNGVKSVYYATIEAANKETMKAAMTKVVDDEEINIKDELTNAYKAAIDLYNKISKKEGNSYYKNYVSNLLGAGANIDAKYGHAELQAHYKVISELDEAVEQVLKDALASIQLSEDGTGITPNEETGVKESGLLTEADFAQFVGENGSVTKALKDMNDYISGLTNDVDAYAQSVLKGLFDAKQGYVVVQSGYMTTAGLSLNQIDAAVDAAQKHIENAMSYICKSSSEVSGPEMEMDEFGTPIITEPNEPGATVSDGCSDDVMSRNVDKYITNMNACLEELNAVSIDTKGAIRSYWTDLIDEADALMDKWQVAFEEDKANSQPEDFVDAQDTWDEAYYAIYTKVVQVGNPNRGIKDNASIALNNSNVVSVADSIGNYTKQLEEALDKAQYAVKLSGQAAAKNAANMTRIEVYKKKLTEVQADLAVLHEKVGNLGLTFNEFQTINVLLADNKVNEFAAALVDADGNDIKNAFDNCEAIDVLRDAANTGIAAAYTRAYNAEIAYLNKVYNQVLADFNNKFAEAAHDTDQLTAWDAAIKAQKVLIDDAPNHGVELAEDEDGNVIAITPVQQLDALVGIEEALLAIQAEMGVSDSSNPEATDEARKRLDSYAQNSVQSVLDKLSQDIANLNTLLGKPVMEGYEVSGEIPSTDELQDELDAIMAAYAADNSVETSYQYYQNQLIALRNKIGSDNYNGQRNVVRVMCNAANSESNKRTTSNSWADNMVAEIEKVENYYTDILGIIDDYELLTGDYSTQKDNINGEVELDEDGNFTYDEEGNIVGGLIGVAKENIAKARAAFSLNNNNTSWNWVYNEEEGQRVKTTVITSLYDLEGIYASIDALALAAAQDEANAWIAEAKVEYGKAEKAVTEGHHTEQETLDAALALIKAEIWDGDVQILVTPANVTEAPETIQKAKDAIEKAKKLVGDAAKNFYTPGDMPDAEGKTDGKVTTADFTALVDIILEKTEAPEAGSVEFAAADLNKDGEIGVGDAVIEMRIINRLDNTGARIAARNTMEGNAEVVNGSLNITNNFAVASVLVDLKGVTENDITLASRAAGMQMITNTLADGTVRVLVIAANNATLEGNEGAVLNIAGKATLLKAVGATSMGNEILLANNLDATGIDMITNAIKSMGEKIYNVGGQMMNTLKKGINIIVGEDGSATKVLKK